MRIKMDRCERCGTGTDVTIMSMFNTQIICQECKEEEKQHPDYEKAVDADVAEIKKGNFNFPGIGRK